MFPWNPSQWNEMYLQELIGQSESTRLEFKTGKPLARKEERDRFVRDNLSTTLSAFANSEGGILVLGMDEDRAVKPRVAKQIDGVPLGKECAFESPEQFQQVMETCISPFLPGMSVKRVPLSGPLTGRVVLVVYVPQGSTAYQARDHIYYSRSEFETKPLPDHEVRLRMMRGRVPQVTVEVTAFHREVLREPPKQRRRVRRLTHDQEATAEPAEALGELLSQPVCFHEAYSFLLQIRNTGDVTVRDLALSLTCRSRPDCWLGPRGSALDFAKLSIHQHEASTQHRFRLVGRQEYHPGSSNFPQAVEYLPEPKIFPGDCIGFDDLVPKYNDSRWFAKTPRGLALDEGQFAVEWVAFLDDAPPSRGVINFTEALLPPLAEPASGSG